MRQAAENTLFKVQRLEDEERTWCDVGSESQVVHTIVGVEAISTGSDPHGMSQHSPGAKLDKGKCTAGVLHDFSLALQAVANVGDFGAKKYTRGGWQSVPNAEERYFDAMWRHLLNARHEDKDPESGLPHLDHMLWNLAAVVELRERVKAQVK
jgi:hypothetical protein